MRLLLFPTRLTALGLVALAHAAVTGAPSARAEVEYSETQSTYELGAGIKTKGNLWRAINRWGPNSHGRNAIGTAQGSSSISYQFVRQNGKCSLSALTVKMRVKLRLPEWSIAYAAKPDLKGFYQCVKKTVTIHEKKHARIWFETAHAIDKLLQSKLVDVPCDEFRAEALRLHRRGMLRGQRKQHTFDTADYKRPRYQRCNAIQTGSKNELARLLPSERVWRAPRKSRRTASIQKLTPELRPVQAEKRRSVSRQPNANRLYHQQRRVFYRPTTQQENGSDSGEAAAPSLEMHWLGVLVLCGLGILGVLWKVTQVLVGPSEHGPSESSAAIPATSNELAWHNPSRPKPSQTAQPAFGGAVPKSGFGRRGT